MAGWFSLAVTSPPPNLKPSYREVKWIPLGQITWEPAKRYRRESGLGSAAHWRDHSPGRNRTSSCCGSSTFIFLLEWVLRFLFPFLLATYRRGAYLRRQLLSMLVYNFGVSLWWTWIPGFALGICLKLRGSGQEPDWTGLRQRPFTWLSERQVPLIFVSDWILQRPQSSDICTIFPALSPDSPAMWNHFMQASMAWK